MLTLSPGPSQISLEVKQDILRAVEQNICSTSHRGTEFSGISQRAANNLRKLFQIPDDYHVIWTSSASYAMDLTVRSVVKDKSFHFTCGAFSDRFAKVSAELGKNAMKNEAVWGTKNNYKNTEIPDDAELISITHCETSTSVMCSLDDIRDVRKKCPDAFLAIDITSTAGMIEMEINQADVWLFSIQKGFGLPAGLGVMFVHERVIKRAEELKNKGSHPGLFNLPDITAKMAKNFQTIPTPNILAIYLLEKQTERYLQHGGLSMLEAEAKARHQLLTDWVNSRDDLEFFVKNPADRSLSVSCVQGAPEVIAELHKNAQEHDITIGTGYGKLKTEMVRIANFPAIRREDVEKLIAAM